MNADLNSRIQRKLNKNKKSKNMKRLLLVLSLVAVIVTSTVLANPASALTEDVSGEVVQGLESGGNSGSGAQDPVMHREMRRLLPAILRKPWQRLPRIRA